ncbi:MAG: hypothetical protein KTR35_11725 [Gammaproteobacteria bacterium]|nr:hypothetical protein [Gammaproteobacteria bacterium]
MQQLMPEPLWDEGISSFLYGEYEKKQEPLKNVDLQQFAKEQAVRVGDILETLFLMAIYGEWQYTDAEGNEKLLDEDMLNTLYAKGRIRAEDLDDFDGLWSPRG